MDVETRDVAVGPLEEHTSFINCNVFLQDGDISWVMVFVCQINKRKAIAKKEMCYERG